MRRASTSRRRPAVNISLGRAARLHRLVEALGRGSLAREDILSQLGIGLRTFYRELELLKRCGVKVRLIKKRYTLQSTPQEAEGRLPFPDPQLSFAEMAELAQGPGEAARRLAVLFASVVNQPTASAQGRRPRGGKSAGKKRKE